MSATHDWHVESFVLPLIVDGRKDLEIRLGLPIYGEVEVGDTIVFNQECGKEVVSIRWYDSLEKVLDTVDYRRVFPEADRDKILSDLKQLLKGDVSHLGVLIFELRSA